jgi:peptidyl-prolyl cis-trans isomerase C
MNLQTDTLVARINGVPLHAADESLPPDELRQRACTELLRQATQAEGLLAADDAVIDGVISEAACNAIESLLEKHVIVDEPSEEDCLRHYTTNENKYRTGEKIHARHILFAVTPGVDVAALRQRAEAALLEVRCSDDSTGFTRAARELSNCPSGAEGGELGWLTMGDCAPEFARELFGQTEVGVLPRLVHSRFGLHVVEVLLREPGISQPYESVRGAVSMKLRQQSYVTALQHYLKLLAANAEVVGIEIEAADTLQ